MSDMFTAPPVRPFLDWKVSTDPNAWQDSAVAVIGIPHSEHYRGDENPNDQANAPDVIRLQSHRFSDGGDQWDFDIDTTLNTILPMKGIDAGNCHRGDQTFTEYFRLNVERLKLLLSRSKLTFILGGDHGITIPVLQALEVLRTPVHVVQIDAHIDWRNDVSGATQGYSSPIRRASELPWISGITQIGIRSTGSARQPEKEDALRYGSKIFTAQDVHSGGLDQVFDHLKGKGPFYLTIDADGLDPSVMPAVLGPAPGGLFFHQVQNIIKWLASNGQMVAMDVVEVAPRYDTPNNITSLTAGRFVVSAIGAALK